MFMLLFFQITFDPFFFFNATKQRKMLQMTATLASNRIRCPKAVGLYLWDAYEYRKFDTWHFLKRNYEVYSEQPIGCISHCLNEQVIETMSLWIICWLVCLFEGLWLKASLNRGNTAASKYYKRFVFNDSDVRLETAEKCRPASINEAEGFQRPRLILRCK